MAVFEDLNVLNINGHTEKKKVEGKELTYLSWPWAWAEVKKRYPNAHYTIWKNADGLPYTEDPQTGYMVFTSVTIDGITHEMWLPVMNGANRAMKRSAYEYTTKFGVKSVEAATMMDINKAIMRCLVKNLAMFGLGLYIYAGEDLPEEEAEAQKKEQQELPKPQDRVKPKAVSTTVEKVPTTAPAPAKPPVELSEEMRYLSNELGFLAKESGMQMKDAKALFGVIMNNLIQAGKAPAKKIGAYTKDEIKVVLDEMCKTLKGEAS